MSENQTPAPARVRRCRMLLLVKLACGHMKYIRCETPLRPDLGPPICNRCYGLLNNLISSRDPQGFLHSTAAVAEAIAQEARS